MLYSVAIRFFSDSLYMSYVWEGLESKTQNKKVVFFVMGYEHQSQFTKQILARKYNSLSETVLLEER